MAGDDTDKTAVVFGERLHVERTVREIGTASVECFVFCPVRIHVHNNAGEIMCQVGIFPAGVHQAAVRNDDRRPVSVLVECQAMDIFCFRIVGNEVGNDIVPMYARDTVITDITGGHHFAVRQVVGVAKFEVRFVGNYFLMQARSVCVYFIDLPLAVLIKGGKQQSVCIPMQLYI